MGIITPYATGPSPVYCGSGYLPAVDYWRLGAIFGVIFFAVFLVIGVPWLLFIAKRSLFAAREEIMLSTQWVIEPDFSATVSSGARTRKWNPLEDYKIRMSAIVESHHRCPQ
jgi:hypothetical protein